MAKVIYRVGELVFLGSNRATIIQLQGTEATIQYGRRGTAPVRKTVQVSMLTKQGCGCGGAGTKKVDWV